MQCKYIKITLHSKKLQLNHFLNNHGTEHYNTRSHCKIPKLKWINKKSCQNFKLWVETVKHKVLELLCSNQVQNGEGKCLISLQLELRIVRWSVEVTYLALRVKTGVNDAVHVQVQIVELHAIWIRFRRINGQRNAIIADGGKFLHYIGDRERVAVSEPPVKRWHSHGLGRKVCFERLDDGRKFPPSVVCFVQFGFYDSISRCFFYRGKN